MDDSFSWRVILILFLVCLSGFFSGTEAAMFSLSRLQRERLKRKDREGARLIETLLHSPRNLIITILVGNDLINITSSVIATFLFVDLFQESGKWIALAVMTPLTLIFAEVVPKTLAVARNEQFAVLASRPLYNFQRAVSPLRWAFDRAGAGILRLLRIDKRAPIPGLMEDEFLTMVDESHKSGALHRDERELIHNVFEFSDTRVHAVMTPLSEIFELPVDLPVHEVIRKIKENPHSRIPVYRGQPENIVGVLYAKDLLRIDLRRSQSRILPQIARKPFFVFESRLIGDLFQLLKQKRIHLAICMNSQGTVTGLVTMEDLLEELFGEIYDEHDREEA